MINYSVIFTKNLETVEPEIDKYICFDNKIHIRFRDFNTEDFLVGFEKKFTYLLAYLINYSYIPKLVGNYSDKEILTSFILDEEVAKIIEILKICVDDGTVQFDGLLLKKNYKRDKTKYKAFGDTAIKFFPLQLKNNIVEAGNLEFFLHTFGIDLYHYLFDDTFIIWLHEKDFEISKKFEARKLRKLNKKTNKNNDIVQLW